MDRVSIIRADVRGSIGSISMAILALSCVAATAGDAGFETVEKKKDQYRVGVKFKQVCSTGTGEKARLWIVPSSGWKVNEKFPTKIEVTVPAGAAMDKTSFGKSDALQFDKTKAVFKLPYRFTAPGKREFKAKVKLGVCKGTEECIVATETLAWTVDVGA
jgi:hypothetical protein